MNKINEILQFCKLYWSHPYWIDKKSKDPWIRIRALPSAYAQKKAQKAKAGKLTAREIVVEQGRAEELINRKLLPLNDRGYDLYYVANVCPKGLSGFARNEDIESWLWLWHDIDHALPREIAEIYKESGIAPTVVIKTSERAGLRKYQSLVGIEAIEASSKEEDRSFDSLVTLTKEYLWAYGADVSVSNAARILRLPGSINWKGCESGKEPCLSSIEHISEPFTAVSLEIISEKIREFSESEFSESLKSLSLDVAALGQGDEEGGETLSKKKLREKGGLDFGNWAKAYEKAEGGERTIGKGQRHAALLAFGGQMSREGIVRERILMNLEFLAERACNPPYSAEEEGRADLDRILKYVEGQIRRVEEEEELFEDISREGEGSNEEVMQENKKTQNEDAQAGEAIIANGKDVSKENEEHSTLVDLEEQLKQAEHIALKDFRNLFAKKITSQEILPQLIHSFSHFRNKTYGDENRIVDLMLELLTTMHALYGLYGNAVAEITTLWNSKARVGLPLTREGLVSLINDGLKKASHFCHRNKNKIAQWKAVKAKITQNNKYKIVFGANDKIVQLVSKGIMKDIAYGFSPIKGHPTGLIVFQNGIFNVLTGKFIKNDNICLRMAHPLLTNYVDAGPKAEGAFIRAWSFSHPDDAGSLEGFYRMLGYMCTSSTGFQKIFCFKGLSSTGKSSFAGMIMSMIGTHNATITSYKQLAEKDSLVSSIGKIVTIVEEAESDDPKIHNAAGKRLKEVTSGQNVSIRELYKGEREERIVSKFLLLTNRGIEFEDAGGAMQRRLVTFKFNHPIPSHMRIEDELFRKTLLQEADEITSEAARRYSAAIRECKGDTLFEINSSALEQGRAENLEDINPVKFYLHKYVQVTQNKDDKIMSRMLINILSAMIPANKRKRLDIIVKNELIGADFNLVYNKSLRVANLDYQFRGYEYAKLNLDKVYEDMESDKILMGLDVMQLKIAENLGIDISKKRHIINREEGEFNDITDDESNL